MKIVDGHGVENGMRKGKMCPVHLPPAAYPVLEYSVEG